MSKELLLVVDAVAAEKGVPESVILEAIEAALASAAKKRYVDQDVLVRVQIDPKDGSYETFRRWEVVADDVVMESPDRQIRLMDAVDEAEGVEVGDYIEEQIENVDFGRIAAQAAKQAHHQFRHRRTDAHDADTDHKLGYIVPLCDAARSVHQPGCTEKCKSDPY